MSLNHVFFKSISGGKSPNDLIEAILNNHPQEQTETIQSNWPLKLFYCNFKGHVSHKVW